MNDTSGQQPADRSTQLAKERTDLAMTRTIIAAERTLMAWIRTSISMIGFGFTIFKFVQYLRDSQKAAGTVHIHSARNLGLAFVTLGTLALVAAAIQHRVFLNEMGVKEGKRLWSIAFIVALVMVVIGLLAFVSIMTGRGPL